MDTERIRPELSMREQQLIDLATEGLTDIAISIKLNISESTVKSYWGRVRSKLGSFNRIELVSQNLKENYLRETASLNLEIDRLRSALRESGRRAIELEVQLHEDSPDAIFAVDRFGKFIWINLEAEIMFKYRYDEIVNEHISTLIPDEIHRKERARIHSFYDTMLSEGIGQNVPTFGRKKGGEGFPIAVSFDLIETQNGSIVTCFIRDISESESIILHSAQ